MSVLKAVGISVPLLLVAGGARLYWSYRQAMGEADRGWSQIATRKRPSGAAFHPTMVSDLPEVAQRYFRHAIAPGTPLTGTVELQMEGTFLLGNRRSFQTYDMEARQILAPPGEFVWIPSMRSGLMHITGSDALVSGKAWTRFWINGLIPVINTKSSPDLVRSAAFRSAMEAIWVPAALLPREGVRWQQMAPDVARVTITIAGQATGIDIRLQPSGAVREVVGQRWSNANPERVFRWQPFGGTIEAEATFGGYTIPSVVKVGNHCGTDDYLPFFQAEVTEARYH